MGIERIQAYNMGFYLCLGITIVGVVLAVTFFFMLHIKDAWKMSSGRARSESIRNIREGTKQENRNIYFSITKNIMLIHTDEKI